MTAALRSLKPNSVGIRITDSSGIQMVENRTIVEWSAKRTTVRLTDQNSDHHLVNGQPFG